MTKQQVKQALVIDDEPDILELLTMTLSGMSIDCITAENLAQAHQALKQHKFDLCFTDMRLPDGNGLDFVKTLQKQCPELPVAVITAHGNVDHAVEALKSGAFDFVSKPLKLRMLRDLVEAALKLSPDRPQQRERRSRDKLLGDTDQLLADYNHAAEQWGWDARIQRPRRRWYQGARWILILASAQVGLCVGSCAAFNALESEVRVLRRAQEVLR